MKFKRIGLFVILLCVQLSTALAGPVIGNVRCKKDPSQSYALYIPERGNNAALPIVYFFDPHGAGALPLNKYKVLADRYGFILVGSNNSRNGNNWKTSEKIWKSLWEDTRDRLKIDVNRVYTCGFSGGAKVASFIAIETPGIKGIIVGGSGLPDGVSGTDFSFGVTILAGLGDMNMTDLVNLNQVLDKTRTRHRLVLFDGKHEWAPEKIMNTAFVALQLDAMQAGLIGRNAAFIDKYAADSKLRVAAYKQSNALVRAMRDCQLSIRMLDGVSEEVKWFVDQQKALSADAAYKTQQEADAALLTREQNIKTEYMQEFQRGEMPYWIKTINDLKIKANTSGATAEGGMYQRLLAYLSLAFYTISNHLIEEYNSEAGHFVELYKLADPTNPEAWYFSAILNARGGQKQIAEHDLSVAIEYGFTDKARMEHESEFQKVFSRADLNRLEAKIH